VLRNLRTANSRLDSAIALHQLDLKRTSMNTSTVFDNLSKLLASGLPRRAVLRGAIGLTVAGIFHAFGLRRLAYAAAPPIAEFQIADVLYYNCKYENSESSLVQLERDGCGDPPSKVKSICVGKMNCDVFDVTKKQFGSGWRLAFCDANLNGSCPKAVACWKQRGSLIKQIKAVSVEG
jgi:hypothetical protein